MNSFRFFLRRASLRVFIAVTFYDQPSHVRAVVRALFWIALGLNLEHLAGLRGRGAQLIEELERSDITEGQERILTAAFSAVPMPSVSPRHV